MEKDLFGRIMRDDLPSPAEAPELFDGILGRRVMAFFIDCIVMGALVLAVWIVSAIMGLVTFGLAWLAIPITVPLVFIAYYAVTLGSRSRATLGMRAMDIVLTPTRATTLDGWTAIIHVILFWVSTSILTPFVLALGLFTGRRQLLHDLVVGALMVRKSPMVRHWSDVSRQIPA